MTALPTLTHPSINRNTELLEHVIHTLQSPELISDINLTQDGRIRFNYDGIRYIVYHRGFVSIAEPGIEIGGQPEAAAMKRLLDLDNPDVQAKFTKEA